VRVSSCCLSRSCTKGRTRCMMDKGYDSEGLGGALWTDSAERCRGSYAEVLSFRLFDALFRLLDALGGKLEVSE
jgi:hypothetical protein